LARRNQYGYAGEQMETVMTNPVLRGFKSLARFSGRDTIGQFWPYAGVVFVGVLALGGAAMAWAMQGMIAAMQTFAAEHPEAATTQSSPGSYSISIDASHPDAPTLDFSAFFGVLAIVVVVAVVLLAAAVCRRLHDCNRPGFLGLAPVVFLVGGLSLFPMMMADMAGETEPNMGLFFGLFLNNIAYLGALLALIIQCTRKGTSGANRYGADPLET